MPIKWSALKVSDAADMIEEFVKQAAEPLEQARIVATEARTIADLPQYVDQHLARIQFEIGRVIGGDQFEPVGKLKAGIIAIRNSLPKQAIGDEQAKLKQLSLTI